MKRVQRKLEDETNPAIQEIKAAMKGNKDLRMHERYQTILMMLHGDPYAQISKVTGRSMATIFNYVRAYRERGIDALNMGHSTARPRKLTPEEEQQVYQAVVSQRPLTSDFR